MKFTTTMCHSHLLWMLMNTKDFEQAVFKYHATSPAYQSEGVAGYIETTVDFELKSLSQFSELYNAYYKLDCDQRIKWYNDVCYGAGLRM